MSKFKVGDLVVQSDDAYSFIENGKPYLVCSLTDDDFMVISASKVPVWKRDFCLYEPETLDES